ncbi:hypothetical protein Hanom_Chr08g00720031 [Helianthus anomalus]
MFFFLEKRAEFPLFLDAPDNTSCRFIFKNSTQFNQGPTICKLCQLYDECNVIYNQSVSRARFT